MATTDSEYAGPLGLLLEFVKPGLHLQSGVLLGWDHFGQLLFRFLMFWLVGQIGPFVGIVPMIVEFLGAVFVTNVPPCLLYTSDAADED